MSAAQETVKFARLMHKIFLGTIALYAYVGETIARSEAEPETLKLLRIVFFAVAVSNVALAMVFRRRMVEQVEEVLARDAANSEALQRWRGGNVLTFVSCEAVALYGIVLRFLGAPLREAGAFYVVAAALLLIWAPRGEFARET